MDKNKKSLEKEEYVFSKKYEERKKELLDRFFGAKKPPKK